MSQALLTRIVRLLRTGQLTIPAEFRRRLGIDDDTLLELTLREGKIEDAQRLLLESIAADRKTPNPDYTPRILTPRFGSKSPSSHRGPSLKTDR